MLLKDGRILANLKKYAANKTTCNENLIHVQIETIFYRGYNWGGRIFIVNIIYYSKVWLTINGITKSPISVLIGQHHSDIDQEDTHWPPIPFRYQALPCK